MVYERANWLQKLELEYLNMIIALTFHREGSWRRLIERCPRLALIELEVGQRYGFVLTVLFFDATEFACTVSKPTVSCPLYLIPMLARPILSSLLRKTISETPRDIHHLRVRGKTVKSPSRFLL